MKNQQIIDKNAKNLMTHSGEKPHCSWIHVYEKYDN